MAAAAETVAAAPLVQNMSGNRVAPLEDKPELPLPVNGGLDDGPLDGQRLQDIKVVGEEPPMGVVPEHRSSAQIEVDGSLSDLPEGEPMLISKEALARAELAQEALDRWGICGGADDKGKSDNKDGNSGMDCEAPEKDKEEEGPVPWRKRKITRVILALLSAALIAAGVFLQIHEESPETKVSFRWCYFIAGIFPAYLFAEWSLNYAMHIIETLFFQEYLAQLDSLKKAFRRSLFLAILLIWQRSMFQWGFCWGDYAATCSDPTYRESSRAWMNAIMCCFVGTLATLLAATATKVLSTHFYKSTHFKKLQAALDKEYRLKILSAPRKQERRMLGFTNKGPKKPGDGDAKSDSGSQLIPSFGIFTSSNGTPAATPEKPRPGHQAQPSKAAGARHTRNSSQDSADFTEITDSHAPSLMSTSPAPSVILDGEQEFHLDSMYNLNLETVPSDILDDMDLDDVELENMTDQEMERLRTVVVIKTYSNLISLHKFRTEEEMKEQIKDVQSFGKALFKNIRGSAKTRYITLRDFRDFYGDDKSGRAQALASFNMFALNPEERVTKDKVVDSVLEIFKERSNIAASLSNTESMMDTLHTGLAGALHFLFIGFYLLIWNVDVAQGFSTFSATVLALSFVFGNSIRNTFESMLFLFVQHPYDVGDKVEIDGVVHSVVKISLLYTYFTDAAGKHITVANPSISQKAITNLSRTPTHCEFVNIPVDMAVAADIRDTLMERLKSHCLHHSEDLDQEGLGVNFTAMLDNMKINLFVMWKYLMPADNFGGKRLCRDKMMAVIQGVLVDYKQKGAIYSYAHQIEGTRADSLSICDNDPEAAAAAAAAPVLVATAVGS